MLGIINGGLGLQLAGAGETLKLAYTINAAIFGGTWIVLAVLTGCRRERESDVLGRRTRENRARGVRMERRQKAGRRPASGDGDPWGRGHEGDVRYR